MGGIYLNIEWTANQLKLYHALKNYRDSAKEEEDFAILVLNVISCVNQNDGLGLRHVQEVIEVVLRAA